MDSTIFDELAIFDKVQNRPSVEPLSLKINVPPQLSPPLIPPHLPLIAPPPSNSNLIAEEEDDIVVECNE